MRFGDHRALYHVPIVIIPTLVQCVKDIRKHTTGLANYLLKDTFEVKNTGDEQRAAEQRPSISLKGK